MYIVNNTLSIQTSKARYIQCLGQLLPEEGAGLGEVLHLGHQALLGRVPHQVMAHSLSAALQSCLALLEGQGGCPQLLLQVCYLNTRT